MEYAALCDHFSVISSYKETWETIDDPRPKIVIAGSGMVTGGRVLTYLKQLINKVSTTVLLVGYQAEGTRGRRLLDGARELKLFGKYYKVKAEIAHLESLSAHADQSELMYWLMGIKNVPERVFLIHGAPAALDAFRSKISDEFDWHIYIPKLYEQINVMV
jgi:metallo-beta-lactamase family protein